MGRRRSPPCPATAASHRLGHRSGTVRMQRPQPPTPRSPDAASEQLLLAIRSRRAQVVVIGQGYVGLTVAASAAEAGFPVTGFDVDEARIRSLADGDLVVPGVDDALFR